MEKLVNRASVWGLGGVGFYAREESPLQRPRLTATLKLTRYGDENVRRPSLHPAPPGGFQVWHGRPAFDSVSGIMQPGKDADWHQHFLGCGPSMIAMLFRAIAQRLAPRRDDARQPSYLFDPPSLKNGLPFGYCTRVEPPALLFTRRQARHPGVDHM